MSYLYQPTTQIKLETVEELKLYVDKELLRLSTFLINLPVVPTYYEEPKEPVEGQWAIADGTGWNPGGGYGVYIYFNNTWNNKVV